MGKVCLVGCRALSIDEGRDVAHLAGKLLRDGDFIALDGVTGEVSLVRRS
jgi:pyruvate,orthophosphate dikinase